MSPREVPVDEPPTLPPWPEGVITRGDGRNPVVALTFDDGPNDPWTLAVAAILGRSGAKGTFFTVGKALDRRPDISQALLDAGHLLANHSYSHSYSSWLTPATEEVARSQAAFRRNLGVTPAYYRPPFGLSSRAMLRTINSAGMRCVTWDVIVSDWATEESAEVAERVLAGVKPGSIVLLHDGREGEEVADRSVLLDALPAILHGLAERALTPVRLDALLDGPAYLD